MDAHDLGVGDGLQPKRVHRAQVVLFRERQLFEVGLRRHVGDVDAFELLGIERGAVLYGMQLLANEFQLLGLHLHDGFPFDGCFCSQSMIACVL